MIKLNILIVTRNRPLGLIDALYSVKRVVEMRTCTIKISVTIQDNSDYTVQESILKYFRKTLSIKYLKTNKVLPMSLNWNQGLMRAVREKADYIVVLADRRLISSNITNAIALLEQQNGGFICFDHQDVWINALQILKKNYYTYKLQSRDLNELLYAIGSAQIDWRYPMLFNCVLRTDYLSHLFKRYGSYAEGSSPDINFLSRVADLGTQSFVTYDAPCILTNARHASTSNGNSYNKTSNPHDNEHIRLSGTESYPFYMDYFITAIIVGSLLRYWSKQEIRNIINPHNFLNSSLLELSYPKSQLAFEVMRESLYKFAQDFSLGDNFVQLISSIQHTDSSAQVFPIKSNPDLDNTPNFELIYQIECMLCK